MYPQAHRYFPLGKSTSYLLENKLFLSISKLGKVLDQGLLHPFSNVFDIYADKMLDYSQHSSA